MLEGELPQSDRGRSNFQNIVLHDFDRPSESAKSGSAVLSARKVWGERWDLNLSPTKSTAISPVECAALSSPRPAEWARKRGY